MIIVDTALRRRGAEGRPIRVGMVGAGFRAPSTAFTGGVLGYATLRFGFYGFGIGGRGEVCGGHGSTVPRAVSSVQCLFCGDRSTGSMLRA